MATLNIVSTRPGAGKTCLAGALARRLAKEGKRVAYYKPLSTNPDNDPDLGFVGGMLNSMGTSQEGAPSPFPQPVDASQLPTRLSEARTREVADAVAGLESAYDTVLVEWQAPALPPDQPTLLVHSHTGGQDLATAQEMVAAECGRYGSGVSGIVINNVGRHRGAEVENRLVNPLKSRGLPVLGAIPEDREMLSLTLEQVADFLEGQWVREPEDPQQWVDRFLIGGNIMDSGPNYFGRYAHQAVITRAQRPDIQMASLMCDTRFLVLTGGEEPTEYIRVEAQKRDASLLVVEGGTLEVAEHLGSLLALANPYSDHKLDRFTGLVDQHLQGGLNALLS
ncbi:MAG: AAA family ATPase [Chloroflexota bacterium]|nr:AAA family ATPase [Chloroflexota bacterium]